MVFFLLFFLLLLYDASHGLGCRPTHGRAGCEKLEYGLVLRQ